jgi:hypothetical protein
LSPNDIRRLEDFDPIEDEAADKYFVQLNMAALGDDVAVAEQSPAAPEAPAASQPAAAQPASETLNGAQISSLLEVLANVSGGLIKPEGARAIIAAAFPMLPPNVIDGIVAGVIPGVAVAATTAMPQQDGAPAARSTRRRKR